VRKKLGLSLNLAPVLQLPRPIPPLSPPPFAPPSSRIWSRGRVQVELEKAHLEGALPQVGFCFLWPVPTPKKKKKLKSPPPPRLFALLFFRGRKKRKFIFFDPLKKKVTSPFFEAEARAFRFTHYFASPLSLAPFPRQSPRAESSDVPSTSRRPPRGDLHPSDVARRACRRERGGAQRPDA